MKFLVAVDGSEHSARALDHAVEMASATGASVTVVHAVVPEVYAERFADPVADRSEADGAYVVDAVENAEDRAEQVLARMAARVDDGVDVTTQLLYGDPVVEVADFADDEDFDGVFVGHRGVSERYEALLGSVAKGLVGRASVPVTVVH